MLCKYVAQQSIFCTNINKGLLRLRVVVRLGFSPYTLQSTDVGKF